jgi:L-sorbose 1-phosphate reductase
MITKAVRLYGKNDLRLEEFELPSLQDDEILARVITDSLCISTNKAIKQGSDHKRVPRNIAHYPVIVGHELCGEIIEVGTKWKSNFKPGMKFSLQPSLGESTFDAAGYSFQWFGGDAIYVVIPNIYLEKDCIIEYKGEGFFPGSLSEPYSCIIGTYKAHYHTQSGSYEHRMGIRQGGNMALIAAAGSMGLAALDCIINSNCKPSLIVVTDIDDKRLTRIKTLITPEKAKENSIELIYLNIKNESDVKSKLLAYAKNKGFDDVLVLAPIKQVVELSDSILAKDGCLNFFAGPIDTEFKAEMNFYNIHYNATHVVATNAGNTDDLRDALDMLGSKKLNPSFLVTHIGGLNAVVESTMNLPNLPGGKKLIYTNLDLPLTAIDDFSILGTQNKLFKELNNITQRNNGLWSVEAENYLIKYGNKI